VECPVKVDVVMHHQETWRPSSTGCLIKRVVPGSDVHLFQSGHPLDRAQIVRPGKTLWILHPRGDPLPATVSPTSLQILLLDGSWRQAGEMVHAVESWGRLICMPASAESRYWLRSQAGEGTYSTIEALIFLLAALGLQNAQAQLRFQFELHVYAGLCARGAKTKAEQYLETSSVRGPLAEATRGFFRYRARGAEVPEKLK
jgi:hypothetical protein